MHPLEFRSAAFFKGWLYNVWARVFMTDSEIRVECPNCGTVHCMTSRALYFGRKVFCSCGTSIIVEVQGNGAVKAIDERLAESGGDVDGAKRVAKTPLALGMRQNIPDIETPERGDNVVLVVDDSQDGRDLMCLLLTGNSKRRSGNR